MGDRVKAWIEANKEHIKEYKHNYYELHKDELQERARERQANIGRIFVYCPICDISIRQYSMRLHLKSIRHQNNCQQ